MSSKTNDTERVESEIRATYGHLVPESGAAVDLERTLALAPQEAGPSPIAWARRLAIPFAAALLVAGAWWWGAHHGDASERPRPETADRPDEPKAAERTPPTVTLRIAADGALGYSLTFGKSTFQIAVEMSLDDPSKAAATLKELQGMLHAMTEGLAKADGSGASGLRLVLAPAATARWSWVAWVLQAAADAEVSDVVYASPDDANVSIAQPLPQDATLTPQPARSIALHVVIAPTAADACDRLRGGGVEVRVIVSAGRQELGRYVAGGAAGSDPRRKATLDALLDEMMKAIAQATSTGATLSAVVDVPQPFGVCVPFAAVFDVLSTLRASGVASVQFSGVAAPRATATTATPAEKQVDEKRVRGVELRDATLDQLLTYLSTATGLHFVVSPKATARGVKVTLSVDEASVRQLLDLISEQAGLRWSVEEFGVVRIRDKSE